MPPESPPSELHPPAADPDVMSLLTTSELTVGGFTASAHFRTWCFIVSDPVSSRAVIVDPGRGARPIVAEYLQRHNLDPIAVVLTHGHMDHSWDAVPLASQLDVPVAVHPADESSLVRPEVLLPEDYPNSALAGHPRSSAKRRIPLLHETTIAVGALQVRTISTPGHTQGSVMFLVDNARPTLFAGDSLYKFGPGLAAPPAGDRRVLRKSLRRVLPCLSDTTAIFNGHGQHTSVGECRRPTHGKVHQVWLV
jgi:hydroxyacylglutathione hydrolase